VLAEQPWLAGPGFSLADIAYAPYVIRLTHLGLDDMVTARPRVADWRDRLFGRDSYREGIDKWFNPAVLDIFAAEAPAARRRAAEILAA
jgi:glutathione S-transferase